MNSSVMDHDALQRFLKTNDPPSYFALRTLEALKAGRAQLYREEVCRFLIHRYGDVPLSRYVRRLHQLRELQAKFERSGKYEATSYSDIREVDGDDYRIALLLSFVLTNHRFEILEALAEFCRTTSGNESQELLSIGFGTGYELKLAQDALPRWQFEAYDSSADSFEYASDLLTFFDCRPTSLREKLFPLEDVRLPPEHIGRYGKIVLCEILEHLENPERALQNMRSALHPAGMLFATMAINIAQEDHIHLYRTKDDARFQIERAGFRAVREFVTPVVVSPFAEKDRDRIFSKGNYVCCLVAT